jgi:hypothetical protein
MVNTERETGFVVRRSRFTVNGRPLNTDYPFVLTSQRAARREPCSTIPLGETNELRTF